MHCTPAPSLEKDVEDKGSAFAEEGTLAHAYCAKKLKEHLGKTTEEEDKEISELHEKYHTGEMDEYTDTYASIVLGKIKKATKKTADAQLLVETRLEFTKWIPESFGTADAIIIADGVMEVIDFKYGKGVSVSAEHNPQMMIYALGAYERFSYEYDIRKVRMTIVQPRIANLSEWEVSVETLKLWAIYELKPAAEAAIKGEGEQHPGEWCRFCKVKARCRSLASMCTETAAQDPRLLSNEELGKEILSQIDIIKSWISSTEDYALGKALSGESISGWKLVEGRSVRKITAPNEVVYKLTEAGGIQEEELFKPKELKSLTDIEKIVGKKKFAELCGQYIDKPKGKPTLVPESDKRKAIDPVAEDFEGINIE